MAFFGYKESVWKLHGRQKPRRCPCCGERQSVQYVGFARNYEPGLQAQMYRCNHCDIWLDCIWPQSISLQLLSYPRPVRHSFALA